MKDVLKSLASKSQVDTVLDISDKNREKIKKKTLDVLFK